MIMRKIIVRVEGMMCGMCETHINDAIRSKFPQVKKVTSDRKKKQTVILSENDLNEDEIRETIAGTGYDFIACTSEEYQKRGFFGS